MIKRMDGKMNSFRAQKTPAVAEGPLLRNRVREDWIYKRRFVY